MSNFQERLKDLMIDNNCTQAQISKQTGLATSVISNYYNGVMPCIKNIIKIADYFNCSVDYILGVIDEDKIKGFIKNRVFNNVEFINRYNKLKGSNSDYYVAKQLGINSGIIANWKTYKNPSLDSLIKLADLFGTSVDYLIGRSDKR